MEVMLVGEGEDVSKHAMIGNQREIPDRTDQAGNDFMPDRTGPTMLDQTDHAGKDCVQTTDAVSCKT